MAFDYKFEKIMQLREQEKEESETVFRESQQAFEKEANKLYELLKKKEDLLFAQEQKMKTGFSVLDIQHYQQFVSNLEKLIEKQQQLVITSRGRMQWCEQQLKEKNIEVKKYSKIRANDLTRYHKQMAAEEAKQMDELSSIQFMNRKIR
ncbi:flagellar export protein FliJ [Domibacillus enclensis]|uniref:Flagellar FliJ protein n=1 Tax=Domibacillus enclensis TaxID=1017273 RepID=A0A1N6UL36_9BACI|nr:flagellar export protein FliJ [Domibacillus enclensis]OXS78551.1 flagellar export protein FliJ [Domibacillus enclensis]SIQ66036.1 flagellar FliJ protein [Domibacillus enclensis]